MDPVSMLPIEVWNLILGYIPSSQDTLNASHAHPLFHQLLQSKKLLWLFELILPHIFKDLSKSDVLSLRLVCRSWNAAVENHINLHPSLYPFSPESFYTVQSAFNYLPLSTKFYDDLSYVNGSQLQTFLESMAQHSRNPFFGRSIRLGSCGDPDEQLDPDPAPLWKGALHLCRQLGHHLYHVEVCNYEYSVTPIQFYRNICSILQHLPNLRSLHMNGALDPCPISHFLQTAFMNSSPLPSLPHLDTIIFDMVMEEEAPSEVIQYHRALPQDPDQFIEYLQFHPEAIQQLLSHVPPCPEPLQYQFMARYGPQLKKLEIGMQSWKPCYSTNLISLTELHLKHITSPEKLITTIGGLACHASLNKLIISLRCCLNVSQLFQIITPLNILVLDFGYLGETPDTYLKETASMLGSLSPVTTVKFLRVKDTAHMTFEFLQYLTALNHLDVWECQVARRCYQQHDSSTTPTTNLLRKLIYGEREGNADDMELEKNDTIWTALPQLQIVTFRTRSGQPSVIKRYSREGYHWAYACSY